MNYNLDNFLTIFIRNERLKNNASHDREALTYDKTLDSKFCVFFPGDYREEYRVLTHFYVYLYWENPHEEHLYKR